MGTHSTSGAHGRTPMSDLAAAANGSSLLAGLAGVELAALLGAARTDDLRAGELVLRESDDQAVVVLRGACKETAVNALGDAVILALRGPGDTVGLGTVVASSGAARLTALEDSTVLRIPGGTVRDRMAADPTFAAACLRTVAAELGDLRERTVASTGASATERVVARLLELTTRWGHPADGMVTVRLRLTQEELASWAGVSRESAAKTLADLRRAGVLHTGRRELIVRDLARLEARRPRPADDLRVRQLLDQLGASRQAPPRPQHRAATPN